MQRNTFKTTVLSLLSLLTISSFAQSLGHIEGKASSQGVDYFNIFCIGHTCLGIPHNGQVYLYRPPYKSDSVAGWKCYDSFPIPPGTISIDGNSRKTIFLTDKYMLYKEEQRWDTLVFDSRFKKVDPRVWIRGSYNTERDIEFLSGEKRIIYYADGPDWYISDKLNPYFFEENRTYPPLTDLHKFLKLYNAQSHDYRSIVAIYPHKVTFHNYKLTAMIDPVNEAQLKIQTFYLPKEAISAFVYDQQFIGVSLPGKIVFYHYVSRQKKWALADHIQPLTIHTPFKLDISNKVTEEKHH